MIIIITVLLYTVTNYCFAQSINWTALKPEDRHLVNLNVGIDYGVIYGVGYSYHLQSKLPIVLNAELSIPSGDKLFDDFKTKVGAHVNLFKINHIALSLNATGVFRAYENTLVKLSNFGATANAIIGYYGPKWYVNADFGFDKAIVTHLKHKDTYRLNFPDVKDGWYESTGGNIQYGIQVGYSFTQSDVYLKGGKTTTQDFKTSPTIPVYVQLGYTFRFK